MLNARVYPRPAPNGFGLCATRSLCAERAQQAARKAQDRTPKLKEGTAIAPPPAQPGGQVACACKLHAGRVECDTRSAARRFGASAATPPRNQ